MTVRARLRCSSPSQLFIQRHHQEEVSYRQSGEQTLGETKTDNTSWASRRALILTKVKIVDWLVLVLIAVLIQSLQIIPL